MPVCGYVVVPQPTAKDATAAALSRLDGCDVQALLLTFGEIDPGTPVGDPVREGRRQRGEPR